MTSAADNRRLREIADAAGAKSFAVVREHKHMVVDFLFPGDAAFVRIVMSKSCSDGARGLKNQVADLRRQRRLQQMGA